MTSSGDTVSWLSANHNRSRKIRKTLQSFLVLVSIVNKRGLQLSVIDYYLNKCSCSVYEQNFGTKTVNWENVQGVNYTANIIFKI